MSLNMSALKSDTLHRDSLRINTANDSVSKNTRTWTGFFPPSSRSTKPSVEEIRLWAQSFDKLMRNPAGRNVFREFLRTEYSEENMLFWLACEDLKQEINKNAIEEKARSIYEDYISILSPKEVGGWSLWGF